MWLQKISLWVVLGVAEVHGVVEVRLADIHGVCDDDYEAPLVSDISLRILDIHVLFFLPSTYSPCFVGGVANSQRRADLSRFFRSLGKL